MSHPLETKIGALRGRLRRWVAVYGFGYWLAVSVAAVVLAGLADYVIRFRDPGLRVLASMAVVAILGWAGYRFVYGPCSVRFRDVDLARRVQRRFPSLGDDLASAVEFLRQPDDDPTAGSAALRRAVVARAAAAAEGLDFREVVHSRPAWRAALAAALVGFAAALLMLADPYAAGIAVARLAEPLADIPWPQVHHLVIRNPVGRVARGQAFEVEVVEAEGVRLPAEVRIFYRSENPDGASLEENETMRLVHGMMVARRERVTRPFSFRVEGGDDRSMPWQPVEVVDPPAVASLRVTLTPPEYTGWPRTMSDGNLRALAGTKAEIAASSTKPLESATLLLDGGKTMPARITNEGRQFTVPLDAATPWVLEKSGSYALHLTDHEGISVGQDARWEIRVLPDARPTVALTEPAANANPVVTPAGVVPLEVVAGDDLAVRKIDLEFGRSDRAGDVPARLSLYSGPSPPKSAALGSPAPADRQSVRHAWRLEGMGLAPGTHVTFWAVASDYKPQTAKSEPRRLTIVTTEEMVQRLASRQTTVLAELSRILQLQRRGRERLAALEKRAAEAPRLAQLEVDQLRGVELNQRQIEQALSNRSDGIPGLILGLLADLANNKLDPPLVRRQMESLLAGLEPLVADELPAVARELTAAIKAAQALLDRPETTEAGGGASASVRGPMAAAGRHQDAVIAALERMIGELSQWDRFRRFPQELGQLLHEQEETARRTRDLARRTLTKLLKDLSPQEAAELAEAARQQAAVADRFDAVQQAMDRAVSVSPGDPAAADTADGLRLARELNVGSRMHSAGEQIRRNQLGQATQEQERVEEGLREMLNSLSGRRPTDAGSQPSPQDRQTLEDVKRMQEEINRRTQELEKWRSASGKSGDEARRRYEALGDQQSKLGDLLKRMTTPAPDSSRSTQK